MVTVTLVWLFLIDLLNSINYNSTNMTMSKKLNYKKRPVFKNLNKFWENKVKINVFSMKIEPSNWVPSRLVVCKTWFYLYILNDM